MNVLLFVGDSHSEHRHVNVFKCAGYLSAVRRIDDIVYDISKLISAHSGVIIEKHDNMYSGYISKDGVSRASFLVKLDE